MRVAGCKVPGFDSQGSGSESDLAGVWGFGGETSCSFGLEARSGG